MKNLNSYRTPEGYFENLDSRLRDIPFESRIWRKCNIAMAASLCAIALVCGVILKRNAIPECSEEDAIIEYLIDSGLTLAQLEEQI